MRVAFFILLPILALGAVIRSVEVRGDLYLSESDAREILALKPGDPADSATLSRAIQRLLFSGGFDTAAWKMEAVGESANVVIAVREKRRFELYPEGGSLNSTMYGEKKLWLTASVGSSLRHLFGRIQSFSISAGAPYAYEISGQWRGFHWPLPATRTGLSLSLRRGPSTASPYFSNQISSSLYFEKLLTPTVSSRLFGGEDLTRTWRINVDRWSELDYALWTDPSNLSVSNGLFPRMERSPYIGASVRIDRRDRSADPRKGTLLSLEGRRVWIDNLSHQQSLSYNQFSATAQGYLPFSERQLGAAQIKAVTRDRFDARHFTHRLTFYNSDSHFRGFLYTNSAYQALSDVSIAYANLEYRFRALEVRYADLGFDFKVDERVQKMLQRLDYAVDFFGFLDNGALYGREKTFFSLNPSEDIFTSAGAGLRLVYPRLNQGGTAGVIFYHRKPGLSTDNRLYFYAALSVAF